MDRLGPLLYIVGLIVALCAVCMAPFVLVVRAGGVTWRGIFAAWLGGYVPLVIIAGIFVYMIVPADYPRDHRWTAAPTANSLGEIHGVALERLQRPGAMAPEVAAEWRDTIRRERRAFIADWLKLTIAGLLLPILILPWRLPRGGNHPSSSCSSPDHPAC